MTDLTQLEAELAARVAAAADVAALEAIRVEALGKTGGLLATPVVNYPEVGILFVPEMKKTPVVKNDEIVIGHVMALSLSFDHRIIDGHVGAAFTQDVIELLQDPDRLVLEM